MPVNRIDPTVAPEQLQAVLAVLETVAANPPFLIDLTAEERQEMPKFGDKTRAFVAKAATIAEQNPDILPRSFDFDDMKADVGLIESLYPVVTAVTKLAGRLEGRLEDTYFAAGSEAYAGALLVYQYAKAAHLATGVLEDALDDLGRRLRAAQSQVLRGGGGGLKRRARRRGKGSPQGATGWDHPENNSYVGKVLPGENIEVLRMGHGKDFRAWRIKGSRDQEGWFIESEKNVRVADRST